MNRDDIIRMAREASNNASGLYEENNDLVMLYLDELERFAALVAAAERERNTKEFPVQFGSVKAWEDWCKSIRDNEREAIAQMVEDTPALIEFVKNDKGGCMVCGFTPKMAAAAIRARGNQ
jgi:hypothetical protein